MSNAQQLRLSPLEKIQQKVELAQSSERQWTGRCPAHDDRRASLSVGLLAKGEVVIHCHAGCDFHNVLAAIGLKSSDLYDSPAKSRPDEAQIDRTYEYRSADGVLVFQVVRMTPKDFRQRRPDPKAEGKWLWNAKGCAIIPYRLPELLAADPCLPVFIVEGEKDVDRLLSMGIVATCNAGGAGKWKPEHAESLSGRSIVILPDNDGAGSKHAAHVAASLRGNAANIKVVELPELPPKGDVSDWLEAGGTVEKWKPPDIGNDASTNGLPEVQLPGGEQKISETGAMLGKLLSVKRSHFLRGGAVVCVSTDEHGHPTLTPTRPCKLASDFEKVAQLVKITQSDGEPEVKPAICSEPQARLIMASQAFTDELPPLRVLSRCPVLIELGGHLVEVVGYDRRGAILAEGPAPQQVSLEEAKQLLIAILSGFRFASPADHSRALAALISPALVLGGLLLGRAPVDLGEADQSQTGKGYRNKITAAIYRQTPVAVSQQRAGVGSLEEAFDRALIAGKTFISLDNVRGKVDSQKIESFLTEDTYYARAAYLPNTEIDPRRVYLMFTSNKADMTIDLANRSSCVRMLKQPDGFQYSIYAEGDVLQHVRANQPAYLGAVFAVIRAWHAAGKLRTTETRHDFRPWAQSLDWIVQNVLGCAPLMDGHRETQKRMTNPSMNWLRDVALAVIARHREGQWLLAADLLEVIDAVGTIEIPGLKDGADIDCDSTRKSVLQLMGRKLKHSFSDSDRVDFDQLVIDREFTSDAEYRPRVHYRVSQKPVPKDPADAPSKVPVISGEPPKSFDDEESEGPKNANPTDNPADSPLITPLMNSRDPADPANTSNIKRTRGRTRDGESNALCEDQRVRGVAGSNGVAEVDQSADAEPRETVLL